ncbi:MAG TPA: APC family permease [Nitrososphaera sp.]|nr:APC family permease [Nitrososphaera sp.]
MLKIGEKKEPSLKRHINLFQAVMYGVGLILGAGIYVLIGDVAGIAGNLMWVSFVIAAVIAAFTGLSYAELSSMFPKSAAEYVFVKNAFRNNLLAFVTGWIITFVAIASAAAVAIGFSGYLASFFPQFDPVMSAVVLVAALSVINFIGIRESVWMNTTFTLIELAGLAIVVLAAVLLGSFAGADYYEVPPAASASFTLSMGAMLGAAGLVFFAYFGFENLANIAEETKNAPRTIPRALVISIVVTTGVYILIAVSSIALVGWEELSSTDAPLALAAEKAFGRLGVAVLSAIALFATSNTVLMMLVAGSRIMFGMSRERALPDALGRVHAATKTPWIAVVLMMLLTSAVIALSQGSIAAIANIAVFSIFMVYIAVNLSLIWLRYRRPELERPFRSPVRIGWFPVLAGLGFATSLAMLTQFDSITMVAGAGAIGAGLASYAAIGRYRSRHYPRDETA